jgi:RNA:NAD 2'-phosphotransferase (TPT1/KptA family)
MKLYHGTMTANVEFILREGLRPRGKKMKSVDADIGCTEVGRVTTEK